jgi:hypothetical protein
LSLRIPSGANLGRSMFYADVTGELDRHLSF